MTRLFSGTLLWCASLVCTIAFAQGTTALPAITLDSAQQTALGVRTAPVMPAGQLQLMASATV